MTSTPEAARAEARAAIASVAEGSRASMRRANVKAALREEWG